MTFKEFLRANNLPPVGATLITPDGTKVILVGYEFEEDEEYAVIDVNGRVEVRWYFSQLAKCSWWKKDKEEAI